MFCKKCGSSLKPPVHFCAKCGEKVVEDKLTKLIIENYALTPSTEVMHYGGFWIRFAAFFIDAVASMLIGSFIGGLFGFTFDESLGLTMIIFPVYVVIALWIYSTTLGKKAFGMRVILKDNNQNLSFWKAFLRTLSYYISSILLYAGFWTIGLDDKKQGWHDKIAKTLVTVEGDKRKQGVLFTGATILVFFLYAFYGGADNIASDRATESTANTSKAVKAEEAQIDPVAQADYNEGYKAGYVDGRGANGNLWDSYVAPATEERKGDYLNGYLEGFLKGCSEGGFDCSAVENVIKQFNQQPQSGVKLIPNAVN